jgi:poly-gamma-glutamate capsule biosynthesis protein CapA/YwtB (metallophosphatase superfamily)
MQQVNMTRILLTGDVNLMNVTDASVPFARVQEIFQRADVRFSNLECCLYTPPGGHSVENEGFFADPAIGGAALTSAGIDAVGLANNVNYGDAAITASIAQLDRLGIAHCGAGLNRAAATRPAIVQCHDLRIGFLQRSSVYWPTNHEATERTPGIAVIRAHTAYQVPMHKTQPEIPPLNRPGIPPTVLTWTDQHYLRQLVADIVALRANADFVVVSCHWGLWKDVLTYMSEIAHAVIDAGADLVIGHGPHHFLPIEVYHGKLIFYGLGSFCFHTGHNGRKHGDWVGIMANLLVDGANVAEAAFQFVRHNDRNETIPCALPNEAKTLLEMQRGCELFGTRLERRGDELVIALGAE